MPASVQEILDALEFVSFDSGLGENQALLCRQTGKIYWRSEFSDVKELDDELPDEIDDGTKYIAIHNKRDLDLGKPLVLDFARISAKLPNDFDEVCDISSRRGAYRKFRALLPAETRLIAGTNSKRKRPSERLRLLDRCRYSQ
jgi:hypothetical protein